MDFDLDIGRDLSLAQGDSEDTSYTGRMSSSPAAGKDKKITKGTEQKNGGKYNKKKDDAKMAKNKLNKGGKTQPPNNPAGGY